MVKLYYYYSNMSNLFHGFFKTKFRNHTHYTPISHLHTLNDPPIQFISDKEHSKSQQFSAHYEEQSSLKADIPHPLPELVQFMGKLIKFGYLEGIRNPFESDELGKKEYNQIRSGCLNFARDRFHLIRYLSRQDIRVVAGSVCPSIDRKVVNSGKRLRAYLGIDEENVCSSCILMRSCERAYVKARKDEGGRTVDVMRFLLAYGLDPMTSSVENKPSLNTMVIESTRHLLKKMVELSDEEVDRELVNDTSKISNFPVQGREKGQINLPRKQGGWNCPKCTFPNFAKNIKCLSCGSLSEERLMKLRQEQEHFPLKKGDWTCDKCRFMNYAKNTRCCQCEEKPPKREVNGGEWECESCNYINFTRNMVCLKCNHRRPKRYQIQ